MLESGENEVNRHIVDMLKQIKECEKKNDSIEIVIEELLQLAT